MTAPPSSPSPSPARCHARRTTRPCRSPPRSRSNRPMTPSRPARRWPISTSATTTRRRPPTPSALPGSRGHAPPLPRHDRAVLDRRPLRQGPERGVMLDLAPDMASLSTGSVNFPTIIYENHPTLIASSPPRMKHGVKPEIEVFDLSMLYQAVRMAEEGCSRRRCTSSSSSASRTPCRPSARSSNSRLPAQAPDAAGHLGRRRHRRRTRSRSTAGRWRSAAIAAPASRTMCASIAPGSPRRMPSS